MARVGWQDVAIVLCNLLPREPRYAPWLLFSSPRSETWREFVLMMARQNNSDMLNRAYQLNPEEFLAMSTDIRRIYKDYGPAAQAELRAKWRRALPDWLKEFSDELDDVLGTLTPEQRLAGLKAEERIAGLKPEEKRRLLEMLLAEQQTDVPVDIAVKKPRQRKPKKQS